MSEIARGLIGELTAAGLSGKDIARAIGRNDSMISQVRRGVRGPGYGSNLVPALAELRDRLAAGPAGVSAREAAREAHVTPVARRQTLAGRRARTRRPVTVGGTGWSSSTVKRQGARSGASSLTAQLRRAADAGRNAAVTVGFTRAVTVNGSSGSPITPPKRNSGIRYVQMALGSAAEVVAELDATGVSFTMYVIEQMVIEGYISLEGEADPVVVVSIELRTYP